MEPWIIQKALLIDDWCDNTAKDNNTEVEVAKDEGWRKEKMLVFHDEDEDGNINCCVFV